MNNNKENNLNPLQDFTVEEKDIRFNSETDQEKKTEDKLKTIKKPRKAKWYFIIPTVLLAILLFLFIGWHIKEENNWLPDLNELRSMIRSNTKMICIKCSHKII